VDPDDSCREILSKDTSHPANCVISISKHARMAFFSDKPGNLKNRILHKNAGAARNKRRAPVLIGLACCFVTGVLGIAFDNFDADR